MQTSFFKNNRGITWPIKESVFLVAAAFLIIGTFAFVNRLQAAVLSPKDDGSKANFEMMYTKAKELLSSPANPDYKTFEYFLGNDKLLIGFDTYWNDEKKITSGSFFGFVGSYNFYKPFQCGNEACLCLYSNNYKPGDSARRDEGVVSCRSQAFAGKNIAFLSENGNVAPKTIGINKDNMGSYLVFYGDEWKVQPMYIEKFYDGGKTYIYVSTIDITKEDNAANIRKKKIDYSRKNNQLP